MVDKPVMPTVISAQQIDSRLILSFFNTSPLTIQSDNVFSEFHRIGVTHLTLQSFISPGDNPVADLDAFKVKWNSNILPNFQLCQSSGFRAVACADDMLRTDSERQWLWSSPWAKDAVQFVVGQLASFGFVDRVEMVDEIGSIPSQYQPENLVSWWREVPNHPPIAWPNRYPVAWETDALSDYTSRYWEVWAPRKEKMQADGVQAAYRNVRTDRPWLCAASCLGPCYTKHVAGGDYSDGDYAYTNGILGRQLIGQLWDIVAYGASGVRIYGYDWPVWRNNRLNAPYGQSGLQTGSRPWDDRWQGVSNAVLSVSSRTQQLLSQPYVPIVSDSWVCGRRGNVWWARNKTKDALFVAKSGTVITAQGEVTHSNLVPSGCVVVYVV